MLLQLPHFYYCCLLRDRLICRFGFCSTHLFNVRTKDDKVRCKDICRETQKHQDGPLTQMNKLLAIYSIGTTHANKGTGFDQTGMVPSWHFWHILLVGTSIRNKGLRPECLTHQQQHFSHWDMNSSHAITRQEGRKTYEPRDYNICSLNPKIFSVQDFIT